MKEGRKGGRKFCSIFRILSTSLMLQNVVIGIYCNNLHICNNLHVCRKRLENTNRTFVMSFQGFTAGVVSVMAVFSVF
jgi:hypothetical protein